MCLIPFVASYISILMPRCKSQSYYIVILALLLSFWWEGMWPMEPACIVAQLYFDNNHIIWEACCTYILPLVGLPLSFYIFVGVLFVNSFHISGVTEFLLLWSFDIPQWHGMGNTPFSWSTYPRFPIPNQSPPPLLLMFLVLLVMHIFLSWYHWGLYPPPPTPHPPQSIQRRPSKEKLWA